MSHSVSIIGWSTIVASAIIILSQLAGLSEDSLMDQMNMAFSSFPQARSGLNSLVDLLQYNRIWSIYIALYFCFVLAGAVQFVHCRTIGRTILEIACWIGMMNACVDSLLSYMLWKRMESAMSAVMGTMGIGIGNLNPLGAATIILGFFLWIIPSIGMIVYLRRPALKALMK